MTRTKKRKLGGLQKRDAAMSDLRKEVEPTKSSKPMHGPLLMPKERFESLERGVALVWFRNDLRIHDNPALQLANTADAIVPLYIFDPAHYGQRALSRHGFERVGLHRAKFIVESVSDLRYLLRARGSELLVRVGNTMEILKSTLQTLVDSKMGPVHVVLQKEVTKEETDAEKALQQILSTFSGGEDSQIKLHLVWGATLQHVEDLSFNPCGWFFPRTFVKYCKRLEHKATKDVRLEIELPEKIKPFPEELPALNSDNIPLIGRDLGVSGVNESLDTSLCDSRSAMSFVGGPTAAIARLKEYIDQRKGLHSSDAAKVYYGEQDFSSKLSPYLALGCISPRTVYWSVKRSGSTFLIDELKRRDYFRFMAANAGLRLFAVNGFAVKEDKPVWRLPDGAISDIQKEKFKAWIDGRTGIPLIDASMRELVRTGFMSVHGRKMCASYLLRDLEFPDWTAGAEYFESKLIDYEPAANWGNWACIAGVGISAHTGFAFNVIRQAQKHDPEGRFVKKWCPELAAVPHNLIHEVHSLSDEQFAEFQMVKGVSYPMPIAPTADQPDWAPKKKRAENEGKKGREQTAPVEKNSLTNQVLKAE